MQNIESHVLCPLLTPPPPQKKKIKKKFAYSNFPAEHMMKINNLSRPNLPAPPPPYSLQDQKVVP